MRNLRKTNADARARDGKKCSKVRPATTILCVIVALLLGGYYVWLPASGAQLPFRSMQLSDNEAGANANYFLKFFINSLGTVGSISVQFCANSAFVTDPCTPPPGFDDTAATLTDQVGPTGFSISPATTANDIILTRTPVFTAAGFASYEFSGITNPSSPGSYFVRVQTYPTADASGPASDFGAMAIAIFNNIAISAEVPPFLIFCTGVTISGFNCANATGDFIDLGELSAARASSASSQMLVATNAQSGYTISVAAPTMASGVNIINPLTVSDVSRPGTSQFGFNLRANSTPPDGSDPAGPGTGVPTAAYDQPNRYQLNSGDVIATNAGPENYREFTASYLVNIPAGQAPGIYVTTLTYIALATF